MNLPTEQRELVPSFPNPLLNEPYDRTRKSHPKRNRSGIDMTNLDLGWESRFTTRLYFKQLKGDSETVRDLRCITRSAVATTASEDIVTMPPPSLRAPTAASPSAASVAPSVTSIAPSITSVYSGESFDLEGERMEVTGGDYSTRMGHTQVRCRRVARDSANPSDESFINLEITSVRDRVRERTTTNEEAQHPEREI